MKTVHADFRQCRPGYILYKDFSFGPPLQHGQDKTPIGVIIKANPAANLITAAALESSSELLPWSEDFGNLVLLSGEISNVRRHDTNGFVKTATIVHSAAAGKPEYPVPAASFCYRYATPGTSPGDWYLGAIDEMREINKHTSLINKALTACNGETFDPDDEYWTSSEFSYSAVRYYVPYDKSPFAPYYYFDKFYAMSVRPLLLVKGKL